MAFPMSRVSLYFSRFLRPFAVRNSARDYLFEPVPPTPPAVAHFILRRNTAMSVSRQIVRSRKAQVACLQVYGNWRFMRNSPRVPSDRLHYPQLAVAATKHLSSVALAGTPSHGFDKKQNQPISLAAISVRQRMDGNQIHGDGTQEMTIFRFRLAHPTLYQLRRLIEKANRHVREVRPLALPAVALSP